MTDDCHILIKAFAEHIHLTRGQAAKLLGGARKADTALTTLMDAQLVRHATETRTSHFERTPEAQGSDVPEHLLLDLQATLTGRRRTARELATLTGLPLTLIRAALDTLTARGQASVAYVGMLGIFSPAA